MHDWALCVGIGAYTSEAGLEPLAGSLNDAKVIYDWLVDPQGGAIDIDRDLVLADGLVS